MRTVDYSDILRGSAALAGLQPANLSPDEFALFRTFHDCRLQLAWEIHRWPELCRYEQRSLRAPYAAAHTYAAGDEVLDLTTLQYFQALVATTGNPPTIAGEENSAYWAMCQTSYAAADYDTDRTYAVGDQVRDPDTGEFYQFCGYQVPAAPQIEEQSGIISWPRVEFATDYRIYRSPTAAFADASAASLPITFDGNLAQVFANEYSGWYFVTAVNVTAESEPSNSIHIAPGGAE